MVDLQRFITQTSEGVRIRLTVSPRAKRTALRGPYGDSLKVAVASPPADGKANEALIEYLAEVFNLSLKSVMLVAGEASTHKVVLLAKADLHAVTDRLISEGRRLGLQCF